MKIVLFIRGEEMKKFIVAMIFAIMMSCLTGCSIEHHHVTIADQVILSASTVELQDRTIYCFGGSIIALKETKNYTVTVYDDPIRNVAQFANWRMNH